MRKRSGVTFVPVSKAFFLCALIVMILIPAALARAADVTLAWDANPDPAVTGYKIYYGTASGTYAYFVDVGNSTTVRISNLTAGTTYYFTATDYNSLKQESAYSNEVQYTIPQQTCTFTLSPISQSYTSSGGAGSVTVTSQSGCSWTAASGASWITITSGSAGSGTGAVYYSVAPKTDAGSRTGTMTVAGQTFTVTQSGVTSTTNYTITASAATGGTISPSGSVSVPAGGSVTFTISPQWGYRIQKVYVDGVSVGSVSSYTFTSVQRNRTIRVEFRLFGWGH